MGSKVLQQLIKASLDYFLKCYPIQMSNGTVCQKQFKHSSEINKRAFLSKRCLIPLISISVNIQLEVVLAM